jgi:hypothetical protein
MTVARKTQFSGLTHTDRGIRGDANATQIGHKTRRPGQRAASLHFLLLATQVYIPVAHRTNAQKLLHPPETQMATSSLAPAAAIFVADRLPRDA